MTKAIWNLMENKVVKSLIGKILPNITVNNKIWIPMIDEPESLDVSNIIKKSIPDIKKIDGEILFGDREATFNPETHV